MRAANVVRPQLSRMFQIVIALGGRSALNARELAALCEVSRRTIYRDLDSLVRAGVPITYRPDQQGYRLADGFVIEPPSLTEPEANALVLVVGTCGEESALGCRRHLSNALGKIILSLDPAVRDRARSLLRHVLPAPELAEHDPRERQATLDLLVKALIEHRQIRVALRQADVQEALQTRLSPYHLSRLQGRWIIIGRSSLHRAVRSFEVASIDHATLTDERFTMPPRFEWSEPAQSHQLHTGQPRIRVRFRASSGRLSETDATLPLPSSRSVAEGQEFVDIGLNGAEELLVWMLGHGDQVEVIEPAALREQLLNMARRILENHRPRGITAEAPAQRA